MLNYHARHLSSLKTLLYVLIPENPFKMFRHLCRAVKDERSLVFPYLTKFYLPIRLIYLVRALLIASFEDVIQFQQLFLRKLSIFKTNKSKKVQQMSDVR